MKLGLVCISELLRQKRPELAFKTMTRTYFLKGERDERIRDLSSRILHNLLVTGETIKHCASIGIHHYRLSCCLFPLLTDQTLKLDIVAFPNYSVIQNRLRDIGRTAKQCKVSLSIHPDQFVILGSDKDDVCLRSVNELNFHSWVLDTIGAAQDHSCPINIHPGFSGFESAEKFIDKTIKYFRMCDVGVRSRLVFENEDKGFWNCHNLFEYFQNYAQSAHGIRFGLTLDNLHHSCNPSVINGVSMPYEHYFLKFYNTWNSVPVYHWSEGVDGTRKHAAKLTTTPPDLGFDAIYEVEVKDKDAGFVHLLPNFP